VVGSTLHAIAIQDTIETTHTFDTQRFWNSFASVVLAKVVFKAIKIHFFVPSGVIFTTTVQSTYSYCPNKLRSEGGEIQIQMSSTVVSVDMSDTESILASINSSFD
jgi:hypothetical protein